jgi:hypothetical protein
LRFAYPGYEAIIGSTPAFSLLENVSVCRMPADAHAAARERLFCPPPPSQPKPRPRRRSAAIYLTLAVVFIAAWENDLDRDKAKRVLDGEVTVDVTAG